MDEPKLPTIEDTNRMLAEALARIRAARRAELVERIAEIMRLRTEREADQR